MSNLTRGFTMRRDGVLPRGDWFNFTNQDGDRPKIYIYDEIGFWGTEASDFVKELNKLDNDEVELHLNSPGGEIFDGLAIYNALKQHKAKVTVYVDGLAASAASFIAQAGDEVVMARNAQMMIHDGIAFAYGNEQDMLDTAKVLSSLSNNIADIYAYAAGKRGFENTLEDFRALMREEVWYNGAEAVTAGLADVVLDSDDEEAEKAKNKWDLSFYNHAGREKADSPLRIQEKIRLENRQKGTTVADKPENTVDPEATPAPAPDNTPPQEPVPTGDPEEPGVTVQPQDPAGPSEPTETTTATQPASNSAAVQGVMINGRPETDWVIINRHVAVLETAQNEQRQVGRRQFVENLAASNRIGAPQIDSLVALVNGDPGRNIPAMSDEQFAAFQASYESAPASTLFEAMPTTQEGSPSNNLGKGSKMTAEERADKISVLEGTVAMHRRGGMDEAAVKSTNSYVELQKLLNENNES